MTNEAKCHLCNIPVARINGRTLKKNMLESPHVKAFGIIPLTGWVPVCPICHRAHLHIAAKASLPFLCADNAMRTTHDYTEAGVIRDARLLELADFQFSRSALHSSIHLQSLEFATRQTEEYGSELGVNISTHKALEFSERVCRWGGGGRVWGKLQQLNGQELGLRLQRWISAVLANNQTVDEAIEQGIEIPGLSVSFASKHLRMLRPDCFAVLDAVLSDGLGYALNPKGYRLFLRHLNVLRDELAVDHGMPLNVATLEAGIFILVRQNVRSIEAKTT